MFGYANCIANVKSSSVRPAASTCLSNSGYSRFRIYIYIYNIHIYRQSSAADLKAFERWEARKASWGISAFFQSFSYIMKYAHVIPFLDFSNTSHLLWPLATHVIIGTEMQFFRLHILEVQEYREYPRFQWNANICETEMQRNLSLRKCKWWTWCSFGILSSCTSSLTYHDSSKFGRLMQGLLSLLADLEASFSGQNQKLDATSQCIQTNSKISKIYDISFDSGYSTSNHHPIVHNPIFPAKGIRKSAVLKGELLSKWSDRHITWQSLRVAELRQSCQLIQRLQTNTRLTPSDTISYHHSCSTVSYLVTLTVLRSWRLRFEEHIHSQIAGHWLVLVFGGSRGSCSRTRSGIWANRSWIQFGGSNWRYHEDPWRYQFQRWPLQDDIQC